MDIERIKRALMEGLGHGVDAVDNTVSRLRYGVDRGEKARQIAAGEIPGIGGQRQGENWDQFMTRADRTASGYLFGRQWPVLGPASTNGLALIRGLAGDDTDLIEQGNSAIDAGSTAGLLGTGTIRRANR